MYTTNFKVTSRETHNWKKFLSKKGKNQDHGRSCFPFWETEDLHIPMSRDVVVLNSAVEALVLENGSGGGS